MNGQKMKILDRF